LLDRGKYNIVQRFHRSSSKL